MMFIYISIICANHFLVGMTSTNNDALLVELKKLNDEMKRMKREHNEELDSVKRSFQKNSERLKNVENY